MCHKVHLYAMIPWSINESFLIKLLSHLLHWNGVSPVWVLSIFASLYNIYGKYHIEMVFGQYDFGDAWSNLSYVWMFSDKFYTDRKTLQCEFSDAIPSQALKIISSYTNYTEIAFQLCEIFQDILIQESF